MILYSTVGKEVEKCDRGLFWCALRAYLPC